MPEEQTTTESVGSKNEDLLREIRENFSYVRSYWRENHEEAEKDMDCVAGIPPQEFRDDRKNRPCIWPDECSQYVKQANNNWRQNKRSVKISPRSQEAKDEDAEHRQAYIRGIEYASKFETISTTAFESCVECAFGFYRIKLVEVGKDGEQEPRLARIPNWATVYPDPDAKEADFSDSAIYFVIDRMRQKAFERKYPNAEKKSFTGLDAEIAPGWLQGDDITLAEYWTRDKVGENKYKVTQRITNGFEVLETHDWIGSWIPIVGMFGEEIWTRSSGESKRIFMSLIRRMRGSQQMLAYIASQQAEEIGMAPRAPYLVLKDSVDPQLWKDAHRIPKAYLEWRIPTNWNVAWGPPPKPDRSPFTPNIQAYEIAYEQWRRSIQSGAGVAPLPTAAQRQNEKSGIALEKIQNQEAIGSFHFTDNAVRALNNGGRQLNELITKLAELDSLPKQLLGKDQKDEDVILHVAPRDKDEISEELPEGHNWFFAHRGEFEVTVSDGPSYLSQREEASSFADTLLQTIPAIGLPPQITQQMLAIAVKLKNIGTFGDEIADSLAPPDPSNLPPQAKAIIAQAQAQTQAAMAEVTKLRMEKMGKVIEYKGKMALQEHERATRMTEADKDRETKLAVAEVSTKAQSVSERLQMIHDLMQQFHDQAHELGLQMQQHEQAKELAQQAATNQSVQSAQDAAQNQAAQAQQAQGAD